VSVEPDRAPQRVSFSKLERVKRDEARQRFLATTPGERVENALRLSGLAAEMRSGLRRTR
jgi:hypothetical protein